MPKVTPMRFGLAWSAGWWVTILLAATGYPWLATLVTALIVGWSLLDHSERWWRYSLIIILGALAEIAMIHFQYISYHGSALVPPWIIALWALWVVGCDRSLLPSLGRSLTIIISVLGAPLAYYGGAQFDLLTLAPWAMVVLAGVYLLLSGVVLALFTQAASATNKHTLSVEASA